MSDQTRAGLSDATVSRLPVYLRALADAAAGGATTIASDELADRAGVGPAMLRKDLSQLGSYGVRGVGYDVEVLTHELERALGLDHDRAVVIVGMGNLGLALARYGGFATRGLDVVALVDRDPDVVGTPVGDLVVRPADDLAAVLAEHPGAIGVIATPAASAQAAADALVAAGARAILDFAPTRLAVPDEVQVRYVDLSTELTLLRFRTLGESLS